MTQDEEQAARWFRKSAELGSPYGQVELGEMYEDGRGVEQDYQEACEVVPFSRGIRSWLGRSVCLAACIGLVGACRRMKCWRRNGAGERRSRMIPGRSSR